MPDFSEIWPDGRAEFVLISDAHLGLPSDRDAMLVGIMALPCNSPPTHFSPFVWKTRIREERCCSGKNPGPEVLRPQPQVDFLRCKMWA